MRGIITGADGCRALGLTFLHPSAFSLPKIAGIFLFTSSSVQYDFDCNFRVKGDKPAHISARFGFYDALAARIKIPGIKVERNRGYDDDKAQNGGISLKYDSFFDSPVKSLFCTKIVFVAAGFSLRSRREMVSCLSQAKACGYHLGLFTGESSLLRILALG